MWKKKSKKKKKMLFWEKNIAIARNRYEEIETRNRKRCEVPITKISHVK